MHIYTDKIRIGYIVVIIIIIKSLLSIKCKTVGVIDAA